VKRKIKLSLISTIHYYKLIYRSALLVWALIVYIANPLYHTLTFLQGEEHYRVLFFVVWLSLAIEMVARFFPSPTESMGCQKQYKKNYMPTDVSCSRVSRREINKGVWLVVLSWLALNGLIAALRFSGFISDGILVIIALFYCVSDMICILFFCPFQTLMMKNRCCTVCRIYNWDYLMICTPLLLIPSFYTYSLSVLALALFIRWELTAHLHPERFYEPTNDALRCANCKEKLCHHKTQLYGFWKKEKIIIKRESTRLKQVIKEKINDVKKDD